MVTIVLSLVACLFSLSGLSPFGGVNDDQTSENIKKCELKFPGDAFAGISENGLDFVKKLLVKNKAARMNVFESLDHPWLSGEETEGGAQIPSNKYDNIRAKIAQKYSAWPEPMPAGSAGWRRPRRSPPARRTG